MTYAGQPLAVILGDIDMLRPLALAGVPCAVCAGRRSLPRYSRYARHQIEWSDPWMHPEKLVDSLMAFAADLPAKPVLFYESDADLLMISRNRDRLSEAFRFVVPDAELTEDLVDKQRFHSLADRLGLPVPETVLFPAGTDSFETNGLSYPVIAKPLTRKVAEWSPVAGLSKAVSIPDKEALRDFGMSMASKDIDFLAQEMIPGEESEIESYHVYVDTAGETVGEFTGKKIRTYPREFGQSCALTISDAEDVSKLGRELVKKLDLRGVAKFDFKRRPDGRLVLLEVNPRFNLWHHLGSCRRCKPAAARVLRSGGASAPGVWKGTARHELVPPLARRSSSPRGGDPAFANGSPGR
jgi:D-aspartate ligase